MADRNERRGSERRVTRVKLPPAWAVHPDALDETVVHDAEGRPWLVCTTDRNYGDAGAGVGAEGGEGEPGVEDGGGTGERYETQVFYTARGGIRGFPTGHGQRFRVREEAVAGHRWWCLRVRSGEVQPDRWPELDDPAEGSPA